VTLAGISTRGTAVAITLNDAGSFSLDFGLRLHMQHVGRDQFAVTQAPSVREITAPLFGAEVFPPANRDGARLPRQKRAHLRAAFWIAVPLSFIELLPEV